MTIPTADVEIDCPWCAASFLVKAPLSLRVRPYPEVREQILRGDFNRFQCPRCGKAAQLEPRLVYLDFDRGQVFAVLPEPAFAWRADLVPIIQRVLRLHLEEAAAPMVATWVLQRRLVFGLPQLREKLRIHEAGLDDRLIEALKAWMAKREGLEPRPTRRFDRFDEEGLHFVHETAAGPDGTAVAMHTVVEAADWMSVVHRRHELARAWPALFDGLVVDWRILVTEPEPMPESEREGLALP
jgi:hypothetical protein